MRARPRTVLIVAAFFASAVVMDAACGRELADQAICANPEEMQALNTRVLQTELMVAALSCNERERYNRFVQTQKLLLVNRGRDLQLFFERHYEAGGTDQLNRLVTLLANIASQQSQSYLGNYCEFAREMFTRTLSADGPDPADVAVELLLAARHEIPPCEIATEAGSRMPGKRLLLQPDELTVDRSCVKAGSRFLWIDRVEAIPRRVKAGMDILHRVTYTFCPQAPVAVVEGALTTRISYKGKELIRDTVADFLLEPGQWAVDAVVTVPPGAQPGDYMLETDFDGSGAQFTKSAGFSVF